MRTRHDGGFRAGHTINSTRMWTTPATMRAKSSSSSSSSTAEPPPPPPPPTTTTTASFGVVAGTVWKTIQSSRGDDDEYNFGAQRIALTNTLARGGLAPSSAPVRRTTLAHELLRFRPFPSSIRGREGTHRYRPVRPPPRACWIGPVSHSAAVAYCCCWCSSSCTGGGFLRCRIRIGRSCCRCCHCGLRGGGTCWSCCCCCCWCCSCWCCWCWWWWCWWWCWCWCWWWWCCCCTCSCGCNPT
jgi:hypothetical protein